MDRPKTFRLTTTNEEAFRVAVTYLIGLRDFTVRVRNRKDLTLYHLSIKTDSIFLAERTQKELEEKAQCWFVISYRY